jgi:hypothetical protein
MQSYLFFYKQTSFFLFITYLLLNNVSKTEKMNNETFIIENYHKLGMKKICELLNLTKGKVQYIVTKNKLKVDKLELTRILSESILNTGDECKVNISNFTTNINKHSAYLLGLIWADGFIHNNKPNEKQRYDINLECVDEDMTYFKKILNKTGDWGYHTRTRNNYKPITKATTCNKELADYLHKNDYCQKSIKSPNKIIFKLPKNLVRYFLLGVIDGDGCFYFNKKESLRQFTICGSLNQDWGSFEKIFDSINITYKINRRPNKKNGSSEIRILNKINIKKLGEYLYQTISEDEIGLPRKHKKYLEIVE